MRKISKNTAMPHIMQEFGEYFHNDSLFRNSAYLMLSTAVQAVLGFVFWLLCARLYSPAAIGIGSTLISAAIFISYVSLLGFNSSLIKYLPFSKRRSDKINSSIVMVLAGAFITSILYAALMPYLAPELGFVKGFPMLCAIFILLCIFAALNLLTDSIFVAYRASKYNFIVYAVQSAVKLFLPILFMTWGAFGIFMSFGLAAGFAFFLSLFFAMKKFDYTPRFAVYKDILERLWKFSSTNYIANLLNIIPPTVLPVIVLNKLGAAQAGYYYLAFMVCNLLYTVAYAVSQSLFAEGSHGEMPLGKLLRCSVYILAAIMIPSGILLALLGPFVLHFFGKSYAAESGQTIIALALASPAVAAYALGEVLLRLMDKVYVLILMNLVYTLSICAFAFLWVDKGLAWIALAWGIGHLLAAVIAFSTAFSAYRRQRA